MTQSNQRVICRLMDEFGMDWIEASKIIDVVHDVEGQEWIEGLERQYADYQLPQS